MVGLDLMKVCGEIRRGKQLVVGMERWVMALVFKKDDRQALSNWRPITLLNFDYKLLAKVIVEQLKG